MWQQDLPPEQDNLLVCSNVSMVDPAEVDCRDKIFDRQTNCKMVILW